jgi:hypothetical protein
MQLYFAIPLKIDFQRLIGQVAIFFKVIQNQLKR